MKDEYRLASRTGDIILMPDATMAVVTDWDIIHAGHVKEITLRPCGTWFSRLLCSFMGKIRWYEDDINRLYLVMSASDVALIGPWFQRLFL